MTTQLVARLHAARDAAHPRPARTPTLEAAHLALARSWVGAAPPGRRRRWRRASRGRRRARRARRRSAVALLGAASAVATWPPAAAPSTSSFSSRSIDGAAAEAAANGGRGGGGRASGIEAALRNASAAKPLPPPSRRRRPRRPPSRPNRPPTHTTLPASPLLTPVRPHPALPPSALSRVRRTRRRDRPPHRLRRRGCARRRQQRPRHRRAPRPSNAGLRDTSGRAAALRSLSPLLSSAPSHRALHPVRLAGAPVRSTRLVVDGRRRERDGGMAPSLAGAAGCTIDDDAAAPASYTPQRARSRPVPRTPHATPCVSRLPPVALPAPQAAVASCATRRRRRGGRGARAAGAGSTGGRPAAATPPPPTPATPRRARAARRGSTGGAALFSAAATAAARLLAARGEHARRWPGARRRRARAAAAGERVALGRVRDGRQRGSVGRTAARAYVTPRGRHGVRRTQRWWGAVTLSRPFAARAAAPPRHLPPAPAPPRGGRCPRVAAGARLVAPRRDPEVRGAARRLVGRGRADVGVAGGAARRGRRPSARSGGGGGSHSIAYVEARSTGTRLGDPVELGAGGGGKRGGARRGRRASGMQAAGAAPGSAGARAPAPGGAAECEATRRRRTRPRGESNRPLPTQALS